MQIVSNSHSCQILPTPTPLAIPWGWGEGPLCSPLPLVNHNGSSYFPTPHFSTPLSSCPHGFEQLGSRLREFPCHTPCCHTHTGPTWPGLLPSPAVTKSNLIQRHTRSHRSPGRQCPSSPVPRSIAYAANSTGSIPV